MTYLANSARETNSASGTSDFVLTGAVNGHQTFSAAGITNGQVVTYRAQIGNSTEWEVGRGAWTTGANLARTTILASSNSGSKVNFSEAPEVMIDAAAQDILHEGIANKATPADADRIGLLDSAAAYVVKYLTWANLKTALNSLYAQLSGAVFTGAIQVTTIEVGHATNTTLSRPSAGNLAVEGNLIYRAGGADVPVGDGGTGASNAATAFNNLKQPATTAATGVVELATDAEVHSAAAGDKVLTANHLNTAFGKVAVDVTTSLDWSAFIVGEDINFGSQTIPFPSNVVAGQTRWLILSTSGDNTQSFASGYIGDTAPIATPAGNVEVVLQLFAISASEIMVTQRPSFQIYDPDTLKADTADVLTAGFAATVYNAGTKSTGTYTPDEANGNFQRAVNGGAHTLAPPTNDGNIVIQYTNNASAGAITTSSFTQVTGDAFTTTNGDDFMAYITKNNGFSHLHVTALQ